MEFGQRAPLLLNLGHRLLPRLLLPYILIVVVVAASFDISLNGLKRHIAQRSGEKAVQVAELAATRLKSTLYATRRIAAIADNLPSSCNALAPLTPEGWTLSLVDNGQTICVAPSSETTAFPIDSALDGVLKGGVPALAAIPNQPDIFLVVVPLRNSSASLIFAVPKRALFQSNDFASPCLSGGIAIESEHGVIPLQNCGGPPEQWFPNNAERPKLQSDFNTVSYAGVSGRYREIGTEPFTASLILQYPSPASELSTESHAFMRAAPFIAICLCAILAAVWQLDWIIRRRIYEFQRIVRSHNRNRSRARINGLDSLPLELAELGTAINRMADNIEHHAAQLEATAGEQAGLLHELHHRVKNNFQLIASLLRLHKAALPKERQGDIRFIEEHVQAMAIAYRMAYAAADNSQISVIKIVEDVITSLQETAKIPATALDTLVGEGATKVSLDDGIALALCLTYLIPPYFDGHDKADGPIRVDISHSNDFLIVGLANVAKPEERRTTLRDRLATAYVRQLAATIAEPTPEQTRFIIRIPLVNT